MPHSELPPDVLDLIRHHLTSIDHVEVLLRLRRAGAAGESVEEVAAAMRIDRETVARALGDLADARLVAEREPARWGYAPQTQVERDAVERLAEAYDERPLLLVRALQSIPTSTLRLFSDAFRLRRKE